MFQGVVLAGLGLAAGAAAAAAAVGRAAGRKVVMPSAARTLRLHDASELEVILPRTEDTLRPGRFGIWRSPDDHVIIGDVLSVTDGLVRRAVVERFGSPLSKGDTVEFRRDLYKDPGEFGVDFSAVEMKTDLGPAPAWLVEGTAIRPWVLHLHGIRTERRVVLPGVQVATKLGMTSLIPSWRGDSEGPSYPGNASTLGQDESIDVGAAIDYAMRHGAPGVILVGWSLGGTIALRLAESRRRSDVQGLVLIAPVSDWRSVIRHGARSANLPAWVGDLTCWMLGSRLGHRLVGTPAAVEVSELDWTLGSSVTVPLRVIHNPADLLVPLELSRMLVDAHEGSVLDVFSPAPHAMEANTEPGRFEQTIERWLAAPLSYEGTSTPDPTGSTK